MLQIEQEGWTLLESSNRYSGIILAKDGYRGVIVQIIWANNSSTPNSQGEVVNRRDLFAVKSIKVESYIKSGNGMIMNPKFKEQVSTAVAEIKKEYQKVLDCCELIDGTVNDYESQLKAKNQG